MRDYNRQFTQGLYEPRFEHDNCGWGLIAQMDDQPSHWLVSAAIESLAHLTHRGGVAADGKSGDGCGLLMKMPDAFMRALADEAGITLGSRFAAGNVFLDHDDRKREQCVEVFAQCLAKQGLQIAGWRHLPTDELALGEQARRSLPHIDQVFVVPEPGLEAAMDAAQFERCLFMARRLAEKQLNASDALFYVLSLSGRVVLYKGLVMPADLPVFYRDLSDARLESSLCVFHQRFSTNTTPQWWLAQPFRHLAHNGEINTIQGNRAWARARRLNFKTPLLPALEQIMPLVDEEGSDSGSLDNMLELMLAGGMDIFRAMSMLVPPAWQNVETMDADLRAFHRYNSLHMEPWDGPAGIVMTDGRYAACVMDRNGLRPARYVITDDRHINLATETGVYPFPPAKVTAKGRLKPGQMIAADTQTGTLLLPDDIGELLKSRKPYKQWLKAGQRRLTSKLAQAESRGVEMNPASLMVFQKLFQVTYEERDQVIRVLAEAGQEAVGSMGDDSPLPVMSRRVRSLYDYFRQQFAQVTNPPIDPLREQIVMALETCFGRERNVFEETPEHGARIVVDSPLLSAEKYTQLLAYTDKRYRHQSLSLVYSESTDLRSAVRDIAEKAAEAVRSGVRLLVLSDRDVSKGNLPIHALLATGAVHQRLINEGLRCDANIIVETATARDPHHFAVLVGYGATAVFPYLAYEIIFDMVRIGELSGIDESIALRAFRKGINKGLYKIMSKMGISTIASYRGSGLFEAVGLNRDVVDICFAGTPSRIQGTGFDDLDDDQRVLARDAWNPRSELSQGGLLKYVHDGEYHAYHPDVVNLIHDAVENTDRDKYREFADTVNTRPPMVLRDLLRLNPPANPLPIDEVAAVEGIMKCFDSAGMSLGALSPEAHEALAEAMNTIGGRSNSGEGGEDPARYGTVKSSKIKQVASGRFGVTPEYLVNAEVLQIKIAQGAKPGEGGQLPGHKVNDLIARLRYSRPGVALISPPPHHDIYSIEDLAQLIYDLKQVNPEALVSVKLVAEAGVGTIAAGVAKAYADLITIAGYDGGTGASPLTSVKYAGSPWELGLVETQQTLRANDLRDKVIVQTDGGLKTGLDVVKAAILGAESFGFGTMPMVALGCKYLRICHLNNCATGVATQHLMLRRRHFAGSPQRVINYFRFVAEEVREYLALLGVRNLTELIGRTDLLTRVDGVTARQKALDLSLLLSDAGIATDKPRHHNGERNIPWDRGELSERMLRDTQTDIESGERGEYSYEVRNTDRSIGARLSGLIARRYGNTAMEERPLRITLKGTAGQSFGVWNAGGLHMYLEGDANDYVGKGMAGGKLVLRPAAGSRLRTQQTTIIGNTCLYGATGGRLFAAGLAGERFAVRNSGATAVVEGVGDHGCEYMTGGVVVVLGQAGVNFGAGMTGGLAFVLDQERNFVDCYNHELIDVHRLTSESMEAHLHFLRDLLEEHVRETRSRWGESIIDDFQDIYGRFWLVKPKASDLETLLDTLMEAA